MLLRCTIGFRSVPDTEIFRWLTNSRRWANAFSSLVKTTASGCPPSFSEINQEHLRTWRWANAFSSLVKTTASGCPPSFSEINQEHLRTWRWAIVFSSLVKTKASGCPPDFSIIGPSPLHSPDKRLLFLPHE